VSSAGLQPTPDWSNPYRVPALDNGELVWAVLAAAVALRDARGQDGLAARYEAWFECMATSATTVFYAGNGTVAPVTRILNISAPLSRSNCEQLPGSLNDPYEGETMTVLLDLFGDLTPEERGQLWAAKQPQLRAINFSIPTGILTVQEGFWFSSHEQWKTMLLPYLGIEAVRAVFANCERARTWDAQLSGVPGLFASVSDVAAGTSIDLPDYISAAGVQVRMRCRILPPLFSSGRHHGSDLRALVAIAGACIAASPPARCCDAVRSVPAPAAQQVGGALLVPQHACGSPYAGEARGQYSSRRASECI
jgi:hypothetical protein